ncbi:MAG: hypothetical protein WCC92_04675 [Candidatus Korobacteraceae bacterium]
MKLQEVILRAAAKKITWWRAAEIIGISESVDAALAGTVRIHTANAQLRAPNRGRLSPRSRKEFIF